MSVKIYKSKSSRTTPKELVDIPILEPYQPEVIEFDTKDEFIQYLSENKEAMDEMTTNKLNKKYKIEGYRITKLKNVISLRAVPKTDSAQDPNTLLLQIDHKLDILLSLLTGSPPPLTLSGP